MTSCSVARAAATLLLLLCPLGASAETLKITSKPPGATVEIDGVLVGTTPFEKDYPGGYFHKPRTSMGARGRVAAHHAAGGGQELETKVVYIDPELDIALAKVEGEDFPHLTLADATTVRQGENVLAIGNPGDAMLFSVTKGVVSAVGQFSNAGPGTWIQTDAPINPGNSGGPLLNGRGEVIGINTEKLIKKDVTGIGFALSASDVLNVLHRFYPNVSAVRSADRARTTGGALTASPEAESRGEGKGSDATLAASSERETRAASSNAGSPAAAADDAAEPETSQAPLGFGTVAITSEPNGAEIYVDEKFVGNAPAKLKLPAGNHNMMLKAPGFADWKRTLEILKDSHVTLKRALEHRP